MFGSSGEVFCNERLKSLLETDHQKFTGIDRFEAIKRISSERTKTRLLSKLFDLNVFFPIL